jgi:hypothetical protein
MNRREVEVLLRAGEYLIRGVREGSLVLSDGGGAWVTDSLELALTFGDKLELIPKPNNILVTDLIKLAAMVGKEDFSDLTTEEWSQITKMLRDRGYDAVNLGEGHMDGANDYWILNDAVEPIPVELVGSGDNR